MLERMKKVDDKNKNDCVDERNSLLIPGRLSPWETSSRIGLAPKLNLGTLFRSALVVKAGTDSVRDRGNVSMPPKRLVHPQKMRPV